MVPQLFSYTLNRLTIETRHQWSLTPSKAVLVLLYHDFGLRIAMSTCQVGVTFLFNHRVNLFRESPPKEEPKTVWYSEAKTITCRQ